MPSPYDDLDPLTDLPAFEGWPDDGGRPARGPWEPVDLEPVVAGLLSGTFTPIRPDLVPLEGGGRLLYRGRVHSIAGEPGSGKSWLAMHAIAAVIAAGEGAALIDLEDTAQGAVTRLLALGADPADIRARFRYVRPEVALSDNDREALLASLSAKPRPALVVVDSAGEALALDGLKQNDDDAVALWTRRLPRALAELGAAVLLVDHVVKSTDARGRWAIGSQRKLAVIDGAAFVIDAKHSAPFSREQSGRVRLVCAKDRPGTWPVGATIAEMVVEPFAHGETVEVTLRTPETGDGEPVTFRPTILMQRVSEALERAAAPTSLRGILQLVSGRREYVSQALEVLVEEGHVARTAGLRGAQMHSVRRPFRDLATVPIVPPYREGGTRGTVVATVAGEQSGNGGERSTSHVPTVMSRGNGQSARPFPIERGTVDESGNGR